jgi:hypothetical protein
MIAYKPDTSRKHFRIISLVLFCALLLPAPAFAIDFIYPRVTMPLRNGLNRFDLSETILLEGTSTKSSNFSDEELGRLRQLGLAVSQGASTNSFRLIRGVVVCHPDSNIVIRTKYGDINIQRGSVVLVTLIDGCLGVHSLHQDKAEAVTWVTEGLQCRLYPGKELIIAPSEFQTFDDLPLPYRKIAHRQVAQLPIDKFSQGFYMEFSIPAAIAGIQPLKQMLFSNDRRDKSAINKILKDNVIVVGLENSPQPYVH